MQFYLLPHTPLSYKNNFIATSLSLLLSPQDVHGYYRLGLEFNIRLMLHIQCTIYPLLSASIFGNDELVLPRWQGHIGCMVGWGEGWTEFYWLPELINHVCSCQNASSFSRLYPCRSKPQTLNGKDTMIPLSLPRSFLKTPQILFNPVGFLSFILY